MEEPTGPNPLIATRLDREVYERAQQIAAERYDGNMAMLARIAIKRFVADNWQEIRSIETAIPA